MLEIFKYISWGLTTMIPFAGQWFFKFTEDGPKRSGRYRWTKSGKVALVLTMGAIVISFILTITSDRQDAADKKSLADSNGKINDELDASNKYALQLFNFNAEMEKENQDNATKIMALIEQTRKTAETQPAALVERKWESLRQRISTLPQPTTRPAMPSNFATYRSRFLMQQAKP